MPCCSADKELDLVEMAVYGDVHRSGFSCRVKTIAESVGIAPPPADNAKARSKAAQQHCQSPFHP